MNSQVLRRLSTSDAVWVCWPTLLTGASLCAFIGWYLSDTPIDLRLVLQVLLTGGVAALLLQHVFPPQSTQTRTGLLLVLGTLLLGAAWHLLGALRTPAFLILFCVPVFSAALVSRGWFEYLIAGCAILVAWFTAFATSPALQWMVERLGLDPGLLLPWGRGPGSDADTLAAGGPEIVILTCFTIAVLCVALIGSTASKALARQQTYIETLTLSKQETEQLSARLSGEKSIARYFVDPRSGHVVASTGRSGPGIDQSEDSRYLTDLIAPKYPEQIERLISADGTASLSCVYLGMPGSPGLCDIAVTPVRMDGRDLRQVDLSETSAATLATAALDELELSVCVIGPHSTILYASRYFTELFPEATAGHGAAKALDGRHGLPNGWWDIAPSRQGRAQFYRDGKPWRAIISSAGSDETGACLNLHVERDPEQ